MQRCDFYCYCSLNSQYLIILSNKTYCIIFIQQIYKIMSTLIEKLFKQCIKQIDFSKNFGYKDKSQLEYELIKNYYREDLHVKQIDSITFEMIYLASKVEINLSLLVKSIAKESNLIAFVDNPVTAKTLNNIHNTSFLLPLQTIQNFNKHEELKNAKIIIIQSHNLQKNKWNLKQISQLLKFCKQNNIFVISLENQYDSFMREFNSLLQFAQDFQDFAIINSFGHQFPHINFQTSIVIIPQLKIRELFENCSYAFRIMPNQTGLLLIRGMLSKCGRLIRKQLKKNCQQNWKILKTTFRSRTNEKNMTLKGFYFILTMEGTIKRNIFERIQSNNIVNKINKRLVLNMLTDPQQLENLAKQIYRQIQPSYPKL